MVGGCGRILVRGRELFVVFGVLYQYHFSLLSFVVKVLVTDPTVSDGAFLQEWHCSR